jgi:hypothetical protein
MEDGMFRTIFSAALVTAAIASTQAAHAGDVMGTSCAHSNRNIFDNRVVTGAPQPALAVTAPGDISFAGIVEGSNRDDMVVAFGYDNGSGFQHGRNDIVQGKGCIYFSFNPNVKDARANTQIINFESEDRAHITIWVK